METSTAGRIHTSTDLQHCNCGYTCLYTLFGPPQTPEPKVKQAPSSLPLSVKITRITTSHSLLAMGLRGLVGLVRLVTTLGRRRRLLLRWRRSTVFRHLRLLRRVHAARALERQV